MSTHPLSGRVILVTGATRGIGFAAAQALARKGAHIIALGRTQGGLEDLDDLIKQDGGEATLVPMDLKAADGIDALGKIIHERWGRLDGLLANAAILGDITPVAHIAPKDFDKIFALNVTANYRLIRSLDPLLRESPAGRAVFMTSGAAQSRRAYWGGYAATKSALDALIQCYAGEIEFSELKVNLLNPGATRTAMRAKAMPGENPENLPNPADIAPLIVEMLSPDYEKNGEIITFRQTDYYT